MTKQSNPHISGSPPEELIQASTNGDKPAKPSDLSASNHPPELAINPPDPPASGDELAKPSDLSASNHPPEPAINHLDPSASGDKSAKPSDLPARNLQPSQSNEFDNPPQPKKKKTESEMLLDGLHQGMTLDGSRLRKPRK